VQSGVADDTVSELDLGRGDLVAVADGDLHVELAGALVDQQDAEGAVVDDPAREIRDARQQLVEVQDRPELAADLRERLERAGVIALLLEEPRVFDRHRDVRAELAQQHLVDLGELPFGVAEQVQRADDAPLASQRDDELGLRAGHRLAVARIGMDVVDQQRLPFGDGGADQPLPDLHPQRPHDIVRIADRVGDRELFGARVEEIDGERLELGDARDQLRDLLQQLVEIEHRRDLSPQLEQGDDQLPDVGRCDGRRCDGFGHGG
jgi:hypothetical protein